VVTTKGDGGEDLELVDGPMELRRSFIDDRGEHGVDNEVGSCGGG